jgi:predicted AlkP superfamily pyrophosphatase or phosphodiesterase
MEFPMIFRRPRLAFTLVLFGFIVSLGFAIPLESGQEKTPKIKLAVFVVFDQMRGDYPAKWKNLYGKGGFRRLQDEGAWFTNCHYPYAFTVTAAGHASLLTGTSPYRHGIVSNEWYDRPSGERVTSVFSKKYRPVPAPRDDGKIIYGASPDRRLVPSLGDMLLDTHKGKSKVVSLSIKDRAAILLAALRSLCLWFSTAAGSFVTSDYYAETLPRWATEFNKEKMADQWYGKDWDRLLPDLDYVKFSSADNPFQGLGYKQGRTFPHPTTGGKDKVGRDYYQAMTCSPYGNELLLALAKRAIVAEKLGQGETPDLLCLSFSSNDLIGHTWGPDSQEVLDVTLRSDRIIKELLDFLDDKVGKDSYLFAMSADHGVCPIPEIAKSKGKEAGRVPPDVFTTQAEAFLDETFAKKDEKLPWIESVGGEGVYLNLGNLKNLGLKQPAVEKALADWLAKQPGIQAAYTRPQLTKGPLKEDPIGEMVRRSFHPDRNGDVVAVLKPYYQVSPAITSPKLDTYRTSHGSPHAYDTHVPLFVFGPGIRPGIREERITPQTVAAILAEGLGIPPPTQAEYAVPKGFWK